MYPLILLIILLISDVCLAEDWQQDSHIKYRFSSTHYPTDSLQNEQFGAQSTDHSLNFRHNLSYKNGSWAAELSYAAAALYGDSLLAADQFPSSSLSNTVLADDDSRLADLSRVFSTGRKRAALHRLDRLAITYQTASSVFKVGRHALSWGNGLAFNPMDFFNPFDPTAIDTEYKPGDDMLYAQRLFESGSDLQAVFVTRRLNGHTSSEANSFAAKYHGFIGQSEIDILAARHFDDSLFGLGAITDIGGAVLRGDVVGIDTGDETHLSLVTNLSYSWTWLDKNVSAFVEYFHNGLGLNQNHYRELLSSRNRSLLERLNRGELFSIGKNYVAGAATIELNPLWVLTPTFLNNLDDGSALLQVTSQHDLQQDLQLLASFSAPLGPSGTEYGGLPVPGIGVVSRDWSVLAQLAWYF